MLTLIEGLPVESNYIATLRGDKGWRGWSEDTLILSQIYDAVNINTTATGQWKKGQAPKFPKWPLPGSKNRKTDKKKKVTVADLWARFNAAKSKD